ncbi:hypothetical protein E4T43_06812 [Aureobasidium subglaciale]|nr:hypothetical protein E4T43_06812 [Aureobasidium subglaciale]
MPDPHEMLAGPSPMSRGPTPRTARPGAKRITLIFENCATISQRGDWESDSTTSSAMLGSPLALIVEPWVHNALHGNLHASVVDMRKSMMIPGVRLTNHSRFQLPFAPTKCRSPL